MPALLRPPLREYRTWTIDSRRWEGYRPRDSDIVIATYPKCGTTWMQRIVGMLVFASAEPRPINDDSIWIDARMRDPLDVTLARLDAQPHRRFIKTHLPLDCLPLYDTVKYLHVARDGRDACMSWHNHQVVQTPALYDQLDRIGLQDPAIGRPCPRPEADAAEFFHAWIARWSDGRADDFFRFEMSFWSERQHANLLLVHYNDLKSDLGAEMRRIAAFLEIDLPEPLWPSLVEAGRFGAMRRDGDRLLPGADARFRGGAGGFLFRGTNGRWRDTIDPDDLALYAAKAEAGLSPACARWIEAGRLVAGDPRLA